MPERYADRVVWHEIWCKTGDNLSPSLFSCFINPLLSEIDNCESGIMYSDFMLSSLAYADNIILLSDSEEGLQKQIDTGEMVSQMDAKYKHGKNQSHAFLQQQTDPTHQTQVCNKWARVKSSQTV